MNFQMVKHLSLARLKRRLIRDDGLQVWTVKINHDAIDGQQQWLMINYEWLNTVMNLMMMNRDSVLILIMGSMTAFTKGSLLYDV